MNKDILGNEVKVGDSILVPIYECNRVYLAMADVIKMTAHYVEYECVTRRGYTRIAKISTKYVCLIKD